MRPVLIGLSSPPEEPRPLLNEDSPSGRKLAELLGVVPGSYETGFDRLDLYPREQDAVSRRPYELDREAARNLAPSLRGRRVVFLGRRVAYAFGFSDPGWFWWGLVRGSSDSIGFVAAIAPDLLRVPTWGNDPINRDRARRFFRSIPRVTIYVEGTDGSGKSHLIESLGKLLPGHTTVPSDDPPESWVECLDRIYRRLPPGLLCDRSSGLVSELVYGPVLRNRYITEPENLLNTVRSLLYSVIFVYCRPPGGAIRPTFRDSENPEHVKGVLDRADQLLGKYDSVMSWLVRNGAQVVRYDWTSQTPEEVLSCVG